MSRYIAENIRFQVIERAKHICEYCLLSDDDVFFSHQIDHIIRLKHGGNNHIDNLAYACFPCNNAKGSNVGTVLLPDMTFIRLYNPRVDNWHEHFEIFEGKIYSKTIIGEATIKVLNMNDLDRIIERTN
jgi:HNH endonuclease